MAKILRGEEKHRYMRDTPIPRLVTSMALPAIAGFIVTSAYNLADTFFVSTLGTYATGAVGVNGSIDNIIFMAGSLLAVGSASFTARLLGAREEKHATQVLSTCYFTALFLGIIVLVFGTIYQDELLTLLGANDAIRPYSKQYCRYILLAAPFMATSFVLNQSLRSEGSSLYSMIGMVTGAVLNIGLDPLFIFVFGWGVAGASAATAISKFVSWTILMVPYFKGHTLLKIKFTAIRYTLHDAWEVSKMGCSSFFRNGLGALAAILLNRIAVGYSESALAAISVANRIIMFLTSACLGFGQGLQPVAGYSWGAKQYDRCLDAYKFARAACILGISAVSAVVFLLAKPIISAFTEADEELVRIGVFCLRMQCAVMPFHAYGIIVNMLCAGLGRAAPAFLLSICRQGILFYPPLIIAVKYFGVYGIASTQAIADALIMLFAVPVAISLKKLMARKHTESLNAAEQT